MSKRTNLTRIQSPLGLSRSCFLIALCVLIVILAGGHAQASTVVSLPTLNDIQPGDTIIVPIMLDSVTGGLDIAGFDFQIAWESDYYKLIDVQEGQLLTECGWEFFQFTADSMMTDWDWWPTDVSTVRLVSLADMNNGDVHPTCNATNPGELARLVFEISSHRRNSQRPATIRFLWNDCGDNGMALADGTLLLSDHVYDWNGDWSADDTFPTWTGAPNVCTDGGAVREVNFYNALNRFGSYDPGAERIPSTIIDGRQNTWLGNITYAELVQYNNHNNPWGASGFNMLIQYDNSALNFVSAQLGYNLNLYNWEYFVYMFEAVDQVRLIGIADINNGDIHPSNFLVGDGTIVEIEFLVSNNTANIGRRLPLKFLWTDCGDNSYASVPSGDTLYISNEVFDDRGFIITDDGPFPNYTGASSECLGAPTVQRSVNFFHGSIRVAAEEPVPIVDRGDINVNGIANEISDWVLFSNYFFNGLSVFNINLERQIASTDINNDGLTLTTSDFMYLYRIIIGDAQWWPKNGAVGDTATIIQDTNAHTLSISNSNSLGMLYLTFSGTFDTVQFESETHDIGYLAVGSTTRMMVVPKLLAFEEGVPVLPSGLLMSYEGDAQLVSVQAEYDGITPIPALLQINEGTPCCVDRGNIDHDPAGTLDISDLVYLVSFMFDLGPTPPCPGEADVDGNGAGGIDIGDLVYLVDYMFNGGPAPVACE